MLVGRAVVGIGVGAGEVMVLTVVVGINVGVSVGAVYDTNIIDKHRASANGRHMAGPSNLLPSNSTCTLPAEVHRQVTPELPSGYQARIKQKPAG